MANTALRSPESQYLAAVDRADEMARLLAQAQRRKSMLVFGPEGVGKTRLLLRFVATQPFALYVPQVHTPRELMLSILRELQRIQSGELRKPTDLTALSTPSLKGLVLRALAESPCLLVLDHLAGPSRIVSGIIRELSDYGRRPICFAARSPHMEDIGTLRFLCGDRSERLEIRNFPTAVAREFAQREAERQNLQASNLALALHSFVDWSEGNPGSILQMLTMAALSRYRADNQIKAHVLYLDFRMGRHP
jgi:hypothetical protein